MPNLIDKPWSQLIPLIPIHSHTEEVRADLWQGPLEDSGLRHLHHQIFQGRQSIRLSRSQLLKSDGTSPQRKSLEILLWGYPRPNTFRRNLTPFLRNLNAIAQSATNRAEWTEYYEQLHRIGHLGISTITKLAYFHGLTFEENEAIILDRKVIDVLGSQRWQPLNGFADLTYDNAHRDRQYLKYLEQMAAVSQKLGATADRVEYFLFACGKVF